MALDIRYRTVAEEITYQRLLIESRSRVFTLAEANEWGRLGDMSPPLIIQAATPVPQAVIDPTHFTPDEVIPAPPKTKIHVKVAKGDTYGRVGDWNIHVHVNGKEQDLPEIGIIRAYLPEAEKKLVPAKARRYRSTFNILRDSLNAGLSPQSLHDALKAWALTIFNQPTSAESEGTVDDETSYLLKAQPATLEVGGKVFKLVPAGEIDVRPLITRVRRKALAGARVESATILTKAKTDARLVVSSAENAYANIRAEIETLRREVASQLPQWVKDSQRPAFFRSQTWYVRLLVTCKVKEIRLTVREWNRILYWNAIPIDPRINWDANYHEDHKMPLWLRLNPGGRYTLEDVSHGSDGWSTVHTANRTCMALQALPPAIKTNNDLINLEAAISRGLQVVNLNSPLSQGWSDYWPDFKAQLPVTVKKWIVGDINIHPTRLNQTMAQWQVIYPNYTWDRVETIEEEAQGMFNVDNYRPTPIATPAIPEVNIRAVATPAIPEEER